MKLLFVVLLGLCALTANAYPQDSIIEGRDGVMEKITEFVEGAIAKIKSGIDGVVSKAVDVAAKVRAKIEDLVAKSKDKLAGIVSDVEAKLMSIANTGAHAKQCVDQYRPELREGLSQAKEDIKACTVEGLNFANNVHSIVENKVADIKDHIEAIKDLTHQCVDILHPIDTVKCVYEKAGEIKESVKGIFDDIHAIISGSTELITSAGKCVADVVKDSKLKADNIISKVRECTATGRDGVLESIKNFIAGAVEKIKGGINGIVEKTVNAATYVRTKVQEIVGKANTNLSGLIIDAETKLVSIANQGMIAKNCVDQHRPELNEAVAQAKKDVQECTLAALSYAGNVRELVEEKIADIKAHAGEISNLYELCVNILHPIDTAKCVYEKAGEIKTAVSAIFADINNVISESTNLVTNSGKCAAKAVTDAKQKATEIINKIKQCATGGRDGVIEAIRNFITNAVEKVKAGIESAVNSTVDVGTKVYNQMQDILGRAQAKLNGLIFDVENKFIGIAAQGNHAKECVDKYREEAKAALAETRENINKCTAEGLDFATNVRALVQEKIENIKAHAAEISNLYDTCVNIIHPIDTAKCVYEKAGVIKTAISGIFSDIHNIINGSTKLVTDSAKCVTNAVTDGKHKADDIIAKVKACAAA